ncbi:hypothetical protein F5880DRAFT_1611327 [Lentinula raphanica]|nr:hypothetical protein F5880DRAFT_1611327 [Lentinula raphanica]
MSSLRGPLKLLLTATFLSFLLLSMAHYCVKECPKGLLGHGCPTARSLQQHRRNCEYSNRVARDRPAATGSTSQLPSLQLKRSRTTFPKRTPQPTNQNKEVADLLGTQAEHSYSETYKKLDDAPQGATDIQMTEQDPQITNVPAESVPMQVDSYPPTQITTSGRASRLPRRFRDELPRSQPVVVAAPIPDETPQATIRRVTLIVRDQLRTTANPFGLIRHYLHRPSYDPDAVVPINELCNRRERFNIPVEAETGAEAEAEAEEHDPPWPFRNMSIWRLMSWANSGGRTKSESETTRLVNEVLLQEDFDPADLEGFNAHVENLRLDRAQNSSSNQPKFQDATITIEVPSGSKEIEPQDFSIPGLQFRSIISVIKAIFADPLAEKFHFTPFKLFRTLPGTESLERLYSELYNSDAFIEEHDRVQRLPSPPDQPDCTLERVVLGLMFWSDSTHLTSFGNASLWPIYMMFGNLSKYIRSRPNSGACQHIAYIPSLPASFHDFASRFFTKWSTAKQREGLLTHCRRELMHAVWRFLLDDEFLHACKYGIVIRCHDGVQRRFYPRIFTYSADYPEKVLLATIRDKGKCPCPRCLVEKVALDLLNARNFIYRSGLPINRTAVDNLLKATSSIPTVNAFVDRLGNDFSVPRMLVVDLLHEIELGVWRTLFTHLIRMLYATPRTGADLVALLDRRFRQIPAFGTTIRRFSGNPSEMKKLAARDFEDLLQCAIPVFENLFKDSEHDNRLSKLLYRLAEWHALAKLRLHSETTLGWLETITKEVGKLMRAFRDKTALDFETFELPREQEARAQRQGGTQASSTNQSGSKKVRILNLFTYKFHAMGDYVPTIRLFATTDNYSTQIGELAHRTVKALYGLTNKRNASKQIAKRYNREKRLQQAKASLKKAKKLGQAGDPGATITQILDRHPHHVGMELSTVEEDMKISPDVHHFISENTNHPVFLHMLDSVGRTFQQHTFLVNENRDDPAKQDFWPKLQDHLLGRLLKRDFDGDSYGPFTDTERNSIDLYKKKFYAAKTMRINYTTYDIRRDQDVINPRTDHCMVMVQSADNDSRKHPFWYARVLGIFHADVVRLNEGRVQEIEHMEFLWIRWMGAEPHYRWGRTIGRLPKIGFVPESDPYAFGFLDPALVIRACHLIPDFVTGRTSELLSTQEITAARRVGETDDWGSYYVNIFVDRDMFMRHAGGGVGHAGSVADNGCFSDDVLDDNEDEGGGNNLHAGSSDSDGSSESDNDDLYKGVGKDHEDSDDELGPDDGEDLYEDNGYGSP